MSHLIVTVLIILFSIFFLLAELSQLAATKKRLAYFTDFWNIIDLIPPVLILLFTIMDFFAID
jgi:hypothetical protein